MNDLDPRDRRLVEEIRDHWRPEPVDPRAFDARLEARLHGARPRTAARSRLALPAWGMALTAATTLAFVLLPCSRQEPGSSGAGAPQVVASQPSSPATGTEAEPPAATVASASDSVWWEGALASQGRSMNLPRQYQALDSLFLQPSTKE